MLRRMAVVLVVFALCGPGSSLAAAAPKKAAKKTAKPAVTKPPAEQKPETLAELAKRAKAQMKALEFETAIPLLQQVVAHPEADDHLKASVHIDLGICLVNTGDTAGARLAFDRALALEPQAAPPESAPPKVQTLFQAVKEARFAPPPPPVPETPAVADSGRSLTPAAPPAADVPAVQASAEKKGGAGPALTVVLGVVAAGGLAAGIVTGLQSQGAAAELRGGLHSSAEAEALQGKQQTMATVSIVSYVVAGAAAAGAIVALIVSAAPQSVAVSIAPTPDGFAAAARVKF